MSDDFEDKPTDEQKNRLEDFLVELLLITRKYGIALIDEADQPTRVIDCDNDHVIGQGLIMWRDDGGRLRCYDVEDSILDGVWPVTGPGGLHDQRDLGPVWPRREGPRPP